jgi:hypothetical protein
MQENKITTYLLYAIGEIILVVAGIMIAVQIDDWKTEADNRSLETKILKEISKNLHSDLKELHEDLELMSEINKGCDNILKHLVLHVAPTDSFKTLAATLRVTPHFDPNKGGYDLLVSKGLALIQSDSLRNALSINYERLYTYYSRYEEERLNFHALHSEPMLLRYFHMNFDTEYTYCMTFDISEKDYDRMRKDQDFLKLLSAIKLENSAVMNRGQRVENNIETLLSLIAAELSSK